MPLSCLPALLASCFARLATALDPRSAARLPLLLGGLLFACGRRTCTSWFRAAGITDDYRRAYNVVWACGSLAKANTSRARARMDTLMLDFFFVGMMLPPSGNTQASHGLLKSLDAKKLHAIVTRNFEVHRPLFQSSSRSPHVSNSQVEIIPVAFD